MALSLTSEPATHLKMAAAVSDGRVFVIYDHVMTWHVVREQRPIENRVNWGVRWRLKESPYNSYLQGSVNLVAIGISPIVVRRMWEQRAGNGLYRKR